MKPRKQHKLKLKLWNSNLTKGGTCVTESIQIRNTINSSFPKLGKLISSVLKNTKKSKIKRTKCVINWSDTRESPPLGTDFVIVPITIISKTRKVTIKYIINKKKAAIKRREQENV